MSTLGRRVAPADDSRTQTSACQKNAGDDWTAASRQTGRPE